MINKIQNGIEICIEGTDRISMLTGSKCRTSEERDIWLLLTVLTMSVFIWSGADITPIYSPKSGLFSCRSQLMEITLGKVQNKMVAYPLAKFGSKSCQSWSKLIIDK